MLLSQVITITDGKTPPPLALLCWQMK